MKEIVFRVTPEDDGGFCAAWDAPGGGGISTQGDDLAELEAMIREATDAYFEEADENRPERIRLHFVQDPALAFA